MVRLTVGPEYPHSWVSVTLCPGSAVPCLTEYDADDTFTGRCFWMSPIGSFARMFVSDTGDTFMAGLEGDGYVQVIKCMLITLF